MISFSHETKISIVDMKVQVSSNFSKKIWKKMKSPSSMRNRRLNTSKCRGKFLKMGVYIQSPKSPSPFPKLPKKISKNFKISKKREQSRQGQAPPHGRRATASHWPTQAFRLAVGGWSPNYNQPLTVGR
jgi:hypothetical protein